jgi:hypothetical protein
MELKKETVEKIINDFTFVKNTLLLPEKYLTKFDLNNKEHAACLSYMKGTGGYYIPFLRYLVEQLHIKNVVELGNQTGMSTVALYAAIKENPQSHLYTVDIEKDQRFCPDIMLTDTQVDFIFGDVCSKEVIGKLPRTIDLLFTDTLHYDYQLRDEFEIYQHLLSDTALVAIDDIRSNDKGKLFDSLPFSKWDLTELCHESGWGLFLYQRKEKFTEEEKEERIVDAMLTVWERKYNRVQELLNKKEITPWIRVKNILKKVKPFYKLYTSVYNNLHRRFFKKKVLFYKR